MAVFELIRITISFETDNIWFSFRCGCSASLDKRILDNGFRAFCCPIHSEDKYQKDFKNTVFNGILKFHSAARSYSFEYLGRGKFYSFSKEEEVRTTNDRTPIPFDETTS